MNFALRSYRDGDEHYEGQLGSEPTPQAFLEALWAVLHECWRVLKPSGSVFVNLGDKRSGSGGPNGNGGLTGKVVSKLGANDRYATARATAPTLYTRSAFGRPKSKMLLPHRFAIGCEDGLADPEGKGWVVRSDIVWQKLNGLPESVTDRCRDSHEYVFHLTKSERYFAAVDEVREPQAFPNHGQIGKPVHNAYERDPDGKLARGYQAERKLNPLGKLPGSVWPLPSEPLVISDEVKAHYDLPDHFAAFPTELVRRIILGWSPSGICVECGEGRWPVTTRRVTETQRTTENRSSMSKGSAAIRGEARKALEVIPRQQETTITGYACRCGTRYCPSCRVQWGDVQASDASLERSSQADLPGVRQGVPAARVADSEALFSGVLEQGERSDTQELQGLDDEQPRVPAAVPTGASDGDVGWLRDGAPSGDGGGARQVPDGGRGGSPRQRGQGRQPTGELASADEAPARQPAEEPQAARVSKVRDRDSVAQPAVCPRCQSTLGQPPTRKAVCLDTFGGTGTTAGVARALGRIGVSVDLSHDYSRLADYLIHRSGRFAKVVNRTHRENQGDLFGVPA